MRSVRSFLASLAAAMLLCTPALAFQSPLTDEAVREAYFLGQRHDESMARFLNRYTKLLPAPSAGPHIYAVTFLTPFALLVQHSSRQSNYSAQQAELDHRNQQELVRVLVQIQLTNSYPATINDPADRRNGSSPRLIPRPHDFWKDFGVQVFDGERLLSPSASRGHSNSSCGQRGPCVLTGATLEFEFPATAFTSDSATIEVTPPEGDPVSVNFDLSRLR